MSELNVSDVARRGTQAYRAGYASLVMDEDMEKTLGLSHKERVSQQQEDTDQLAVLATVASLKDHPGYQQMRKARLATIDHYRSGAFARSLLTDGSITDAEFGAKMRVGLLVAEELDKELKTVESADEAIQQEKVKRHAGQRQERN